MFDISLGAEEEGIYAALNLDSDGEAFKYFTVSTLDNATEFYVFWGEDEDGFNVIVELADVNEEIELQAAYIMPDDGKGSIGITASDGVDEFVIAADITVADTDGAWLPEIGETVDILTIDEAQVNALTMEAIGVLGKLMSACSAVSEDFAALMAEMM